MFPDEVISAIAEKLKNIKVEDIYNWSIDNQLKNLEQINPRLTSIQGLVNNKYLSVSEKTLAARSLVKPFLNETDDNFNKYVEWIIKDWGGIKAGVPVDLVKDREKKQLNKKNPFKFDNIASWSKYYSFKEPDKYAIYDARVIYSLNWLLFKAKSEEKFFPYPDGRNSLMNAFDYTMHLFIQKIGFEKVENKIKERTQGGKSRAISDIKKECLIKKDEAYEKYCALLTKIAKKIYGDEENALTKTEMILFSIADREIVKDVFNTLYKSQKNFKKPEELNFPPFVDSNCIYETPVTHLNNQNKEDEIMAEPINIDNGNNDGINAFGGITISIVSESTFFARVSNTNQQEFENALHDVLDCPSYNGIRKIAFQSGGELVLPDWFIADLRASGIEVEYLDNPFAINDTGNWILWNQDFTGGRVPTGHVFSDAINLYVNFRVANPGNTSRREFIEWQIYHRNINRHTAAANCSTFGSNQLNIFNLADAEVGLLATTPLGVNTRNFLSQWRRCNIEQTLPRCLANVYIAGRADHLNITTEQIMGLGFAWTIKTANIILNVGRSIGRHFGFLDNHNQPTDFFYYYFG